MATKIDGQDLEEVLETMIQAITEAGLTLMAHFGKPLIVESKGGEGDVVTNIDKIISDFLARRFKEKYPDYGFLDEEREGDDRFTKDFCIVTDPLDGTNDYIEGFRGFSIIGGLLYRLEPVLGVVYQPQNDEIVYAIKGEGAYSLRGKEKQRLSVSSSNDLRLLVSRSHSTPELEEITRQLPWKSMGRTGGLWKVIEIAKGNATVYLAPPPSKVCLWDLCGPSVCLKEAGGEITDCYGEQLNFGQVGTTFTEGVLATNKVIHAFLLKSVSYIFR